MAEKIYDVGRVSGIAGFPDVATDLFNCHPVLAWIKLETSYLRDFVHEYESAIGGLGQEELIALKSSGLVMDTQNLEASIRKVEEYARVHFGVDL